jgi:hypothetical protein
MQPPGSNISSFLVLFNISPESNNMASFSYADIEEYQVEITEFSF